MSRTYNKFQTFSEKIQTNNLCFAKTLNVMKSQPHTFSDWWNGLPHTMQFDRKKRNSCAALLFVVGTIYCISSFFVN